MIGFILATAQCTVSGAITNWYFRGSKIENQAKIKLVDTLRDLLRYNLGSIAFGVFLRPVVYIANWINYILASGYTKSERTGIARGRKTWMDRLRKSFIVLLRSVNRLAHIEVMYLIQLPLYNESFIESARLADSLLTDKIKSIATFQSATKFAIFLGQLAISIAVTLGGLYLCFSTRPNENAFADNSYVIIFIAASSIVVTLICLGTYSIAIDTLLLCYCEDVKRNNGSAQKPYYMSVRLRSLMHQDVEIISLASLK